MADNSTRIVLTAEDRTQQAFRTAIGGIKDFERGIGQLDAVAARIPLLGAALSAALGGVSFVGLTKGALDAADELSKLSQKVGISVEDLSKLKFAGELSDVSLEALSNGFKKLSKNMQDTAAGTGDAMDAFAAIGITVTNSSGGLKDVDQVLGEIADKFADMENGAGKAALAQRMLGKSGADLVTLLNGGAQAIRDMGLEAEQLGIVITADMGAASEHFNDNLTRIKASAQGLGISLANQLLPTLNEISDAMVQAAKDGGVLKALFVGFGGVVEEGFAAPWRKSIDAVRANMAMLMADAERALSKVTWGDIAARHIKAAAEFDQAAKDILRPYQENPSAAVKGGDTGGKPKLKPAPLLADKSGSKKDPLADAYKAHAELAKEAEKEWQQLQKSAEDYARAVQALIGPIEQQAYTMERANATYGQTEAEIQTALVAQLEEARALAAANGAWEQHLNVLDREIEARRRIAEASKEADLDRLLGATLSAGIEKAQKDMLLLVDALESGRISEEQYIEAVQARLDLTADKIQEVDNFARDMGLTFASAFEDAIIGGKDLQDVLKGLAQDIERIVLRKTITEPLGNAISGVLKDSGIGSSFGDFFKGMLPSYAVGTPFVPQDQLAFLHRGEAVIPADVNRLGGGSAAPVVVTQNINIDSRSDAATIRMAMVQAKNETLAAISSAQRRGAA